MEARSLSEALKLIMRQRKCSQADLGRELGVSQDWVSIVILGKRDPGFKSATMRLARVGWEVVIRPKKEESDPVKRREFHQRVITVGAASAVEAARSATFIPSPTGDPFKDPAYIGNLAARLATSQRENGGMAVLSAASRHFTKVCSLVTGKDIQLQRAASYLARQIAWTLQDARRYEAAENVAATAFQLARGADDIEAQGLALSCLSNNDIERRRTTGTKYAYAGMQLHEIDPSDHALLTIRMGRSLALVGGRERDARQHIDRALSAEGLSLFDASEIMGHAGWGLLDLGLYADAYSSLGEAAELREQWPALHANCLGGQVQAALHAHERTPRGSWLEMAVERMHAFARAVPLVSSARVDSRVIDILAATTQWNKVPAIRAARDQLRGVAPPQPAGS
jgi:transcriptional regulator with XRE-family HTH domain